MWRGCSGCQPQIPFGNLMVYAKRGVYAEMPVVKLYANLRKLAGVRELSIPGVTVGAVVSQLVKEKPPVGEIILHDGELAPHIVLTLNGHNVFDFGTSVTEQDIIAIFPPIAGG